MMRLLFSIAFILIASSSISQVLKGNLSKRKVLIGEPITLTYSIETDASSTISFEAELREIEVQTKTGGVLNSDGKKVEIREPFLDTFTLQNGNKQWAGQYTIVVWDSGTFIIPGPKVIVDDSTLHFQHLEIYANLSAKKSGIDLYDIREEYADIPPEESAILVFLKNYWWIGLILIAFIVLIVFLVRRNKPAAPVKIVKAMSLKERTLMAIDALEKEKLWEKDRLKEHFIELSYILRSYLTVRYDISILEKTTFETKALLSQNGLNDDTVDTIVRILSQSDMVKFAKSKPELVEILKISTLARQIVAETSPLEFDNYE